ncbi:MAG: rhodanese-like domain-containing protein [Proteobacteria bacterium]|nr:rhodanese-like domain-containing protein [Pseudomonadota bacterium]
MNSKTGQLLQCEYSPSYATQNRSQDIGQVNWHRNSKLYISPYLLFKKISTEVQNSVANEYALIDIRSSNKFKQYHIKKSFNLPFTSLKTQSIFKRKKVVLIGTGSDYKALENFQNQLISSGFDSVSILDGGVNYWKSKIESRQLKYNDYYLENLTRLINGDNSKWTIVDVTNNDELVKYFPNVVSLNQEKMIYQPNSFIKSIANNKDLIENILLVLPEPAKSKEIVQIWQSKFKANVYVINANKMSIALNRYKNNQKLTGFKKRTDGARLACQL